MSQTDSGSSVAAPRSLRRPSPYRLVEVTKTQVPQDTSGQTWFRYVLDNGNSQITGKRSGSLKTVTAYATQYAAQLNARSATGNSVWAPRAKK